MEDTITTAPQAACDGDDARQAKAHRGNGNVMTRVMTRVEQRHDARRAKAHHGNGNVADQHLKLRQKQLGEHVGRGEVGVDDLVEVLQRHLAKRRYDLRSSVVYQKGELGAGRGGCRLQRCQQGLEHARGGGAALCLAVLIGTQVLQVAAELVHAFDALQSSARRVLVDADDRVAFALQVRPKAQQSSAAGASRSHARARQAVAPPTRAEARGSCRADAH